MVSSREVLMTALLDKRLHHSLRLNARAKCVHCHKPCVWRPTKKTHLIRHSQELPFICAECASLFPKGQDRDAPVQDSIGA